MTSRRKFLKDETLDALAAGFSFGLGDRSVTRAAAMSSSQQSGLNRAEFASLLQTSAFSFLMVPIGSRDNSSRHYEININRLHG